MPQLHAINLGYFDEQITWYRGRMQTTCFFMTQVETCWRL